MTNPTDTPASPEGSSLPRRRGAAVRALLGVAVSAAVIWLLLRQLDLTAAARTVRAAEPGWIAVAAALSVLIVWARGMRFASVMPEPGLPATTAAIGVQVLMNRVAPMRLGELSLPYLLARYARADAARALVLLMLVRLLELAMVFALLVLATAVRSGGQETSWLALLGVLILGVALVMWRFRQLMGLGVRFAAGACRGLGLGRVGAVRRTLTRLEEAVDAHGALDAGRWRRLAGWTLVMLLIQTAVFGAILRAFGVELTALALLQGSCVAFAGPALPAPSVGTIGTLEASWVIGFVWVGVDLETAIVTGVATQVVTLVFAAVVALPCWLYLRRRAGRAPARNRPPSRY